MKMKIGIELPDGYEISHEELASSIGALMGQALLPVFADSMPEELAKANVEGILTELAYLFDEGEIHLGGKVYRPRVAFADESGKLLPGAAEMTTMHTLVEAPFEIEPDANITFEEDEFVEE